MAAVMMMAFLNHKGGWGIGTQAVAGLLFAIGAVLALMPAGIAVLGGPKAPKAPGKSKEKSKEADAEAAEAEAGEEVETGEEVEEAEVAEDEAFAEEGAGEEEFAEAVEDSSDTIDFEPAESTGDHEFDLGEEFEEDAGAKKKKKKK